MQTTEQPANKGPVLLRSARQPSGPQRPIGAEGPVLRRKGGAAAVLQRQREIGNAAVARLILQRKGEGDGVAGRAVAAEVEDEIQRARGGGRALDRGARAQMEGALGADLSGVRVHTDGRADQLNQALEARAFTTGQDVFFRQGQYDPGSAGGRELLAHELTHVVQQGGAAAQGDAVQAKLTVGAVDDEYEQEADQVARQVMRKEQESVRRRPEAEEAQSEEPQREQTGEEDMEHD